MRIEIKDDFDLNIIIYSGQCFRPFEKNGKYYFLFQDKLLEIFEIEPNMYEISCSLNEWNNIWVPYFDLKTNYSDIRSYLSGQDDYLNICTKAGKGIRILRQDKWEMLISFIISQRKSIPAIRSSVEKLCVLYGEKLTEDLYTFPTVDSLSNATEEELKSCGLGYRVPYIMDAANRVKSKALNLDILDELCDEELFDELVKIKGVGTKVANCVELFGYHRVERAPVDTWINKVINEQYGGINPFDRLKWAGIAQQYIFYYAQNVSRKNT